jgi:hypothetical protein
MEDILIFLRKNCNASRTLSFSKGAGSQISTAAAFAIAGLSDMVGALVKRKPRTSENSVRDQGSAIAFSGGRPAPGSCTGLFQAGLAAVS